MKTEYNSSLLQTRTCTKMLKLIMDLDLQLTDTLSKDKKAGSAAMNRDKDVKELHERVLTIKRLHHKALNSLAAFNGKIHSEQIKYMYSEKLQRRYDERD